MVACRPIAAAAFVLVLSSVAQAAPITVTNFSFESPALANNTYQGDGGADGSFPLPTNAIPGWTSDSSGSDGVQNFIGSTTAFGSGSTLPAPADGKQGAFINGNGGPGGSGYIYQDVGALLPNTTYQLTVAAGNQMNFGAGSSGAIELVGGTNASGTVLSSALVGPNTDPTHPVPAGSFADFTTTFSTGPGASGFLTIVLERTSGAQLVFDNVRLSTVPEPGTFVLCGLGAAALLVAARGRRKA